MNINLTKNNFKNNTFFLNFISKEEDINIKLLLNREELCSLHKLLKESLKIEFRSSLD